MSTLEYNFPVSEQPKNPLGEGRYIKSAAALIIGWVPDAAHDSDGSEYCIATRS